MDNENMNPAEGEAKEATPEATPAEGEAKEATPATEGESTE